MITVSNVISDLKAELDATGSNRYDNDRDYFPAINKGVEWLVTLFTAAFGTNKITEESLRELITTRVFVCNKYSRVNLFNALIEAETAFSTDYIWSLLGVYPECKVGKKRTGADVSDPSLDPNVFRSYLTNYVMLPDADNKAAERLTIEEWNRVDKNIFKRGSSQVTNGLASYSYLNWNENLPLDTTKSLRSQSLTSGPEIEIRPTLAYKYVGVTYLAAPSEITATSDVIKFPQTLNNMLVQKSLDLITRKAFDRDSLYKISSTDLSNLISLMTS